MNKNRSGRKVFGAAKGHSPDEGPHAQIIRAKYGELAKHIVGLAAAVQWVAQAGSDAIIRHPKALAEFDHRAAKLGKWLAAWLLRDDGRRVLEQVWEVREFASQNGLTLNECFPVEGEPIFGDVQKLRDNGEPGRLDIPVTIEMPPIDSTRFEIAWRSHVLLQAKKRSQPEGDNYLFSIEQIEGWFEPKLSRKTIKRAVEALGLPILKQKAGRPVGATDSPDAPRQIVGKLAKG